MTEAMPFLQKAILLSYAPRPLFRACFLKTQGLRLESVGQIHWFFAAMPENILTTLIFPHFYRLLGR